MDNVDRVNVYANQRHGQCVALPHGIENFTPAQKRRIRKRENRDKGK